jgi:2-amino-4-hydroxy-6-hydroxymethyldihydropteridine diphosphokinase
MTPAVACVGLGGNVGDVAGTLHAAFEALNRLPGTCLVARSPLYRTPAWGRADQPDFLNAAARLETTLAPLALLDALLDIERAHGRDRAAEDGRWGPRRVDLDLLLHGDTVMDTPRLVLPHPGMHARAFVLLPLADVAPDLVVPGHGTVVALLEQVDRTGITRVAA